MVPPNIITEMKVSIQDCSVLLPLPHDDDETASSKNNNKSMFLSNIDQALNFHVQTVHFFPANPDFPPQVAALRLKKALEKVMVHYFFLAGRLKTNHQTQRQEIECDNGDNNNNGVGFAVANSELSLDEVGDLVHPNPGFAQLIGPGLRMFDDQPLAVFQVTSFKCGGFALGASTSHVMYDGLGFKIFLENLASQAFDDARPLPTPPFHDRRLLAARSPPLVPFPHHELQKLEQGHNPPAFDSNQENLEFKVFSLSPNHIQTLKEKAKPSSSATKITGFNAVAAHVWRCRALSSDYTDENRRQSYRERKSMFIYAVDIRSRIEPPLPHQYCGNAVLNAYALAKCSELEDGPFSKIVDLVREGTTRMTDEYVRSAIDWAEVYKGLPNGEFFISSWWRLGFDEVVYPWGKARYSCPVVCHRRDIVLLVPDIDGVSGGVNVLVALPDKEMDKFEELFHKFLSA